ncbi:MULTISPECIES: YybH family protein [unclassified Psychrobacillus]|uniref:YybH family protein n=1 Tax=unclassified Psychrobacillus TaxID=2636677 RepID=UPI0011A96072|nr:nuclear transport factor 2 family protein [Psychrobacillus sp. AK 1817]QEY21221.1 DUF4440 domain-containing protein [Psychrobacillus sp. AK 1817]QGM31736.1 DUF4440 domain-containing protein [Bacillus sp. N3536]
MEILNTYIAATNTHNFEEVQKVLHKDAVYFFSDQTCTTHQAIQTYFENAWTIVKDENYEARNVYWLHQGETSATCIYTYFYEGYINGEYSSGEGRATNVFVKEEGRWLLIHEHLSNKIVKEEKYD